MKNITFAGNPVTLPAIELKAGDQAPDFTLLDPNLGEVSLKDFAGQIVILSVVPSVDTGVCDAQTRRFNEEASGIANVKVVTVSVDLPFALGRWCAAAGLDNIVTLSDHRDLSVGEGYGTVIKEHRLLTRAVFVIDQNGKITYSEYVPEVTSHPDYEAALSAAKQLS